MEQKARSFDPITLKKIGRSAILVLAGTFLGFLSTNLIEILGAFNMPAEYQVYIAMFCTWLINTGREFIKGKS